MKRASLLIALILGCGPGTEPLPDAPYVLVLGTAQDAGLPQIGCRAACCARVLDDPSQRRLVTSLLIADPRSGQRWLLDASPDLGEQVEVARGHPATRVNQGPRPPLFDGVFLTHAHMGHYTGLLELGREAYGSSALPVYGTERMTSFLADNGPWSLAVDSGGWELRTLTLDEPIELAPDLFVTALTVPHRDEFSDTVAFVVRGPNRSLLYLPDIDRWDRWDRRIEEVLATVDVAMIDATFYSEGEIPGRSIDDIPHPLVRETLQRLGSLPETERRKVVFTHLNHTNPIANPSSRPAKSVVDAGMRVAEEREVLAL